jgi:periplasmic divalent cation tolerance protein
MIVCWSVRRSGARRTGRAWHSFYRWKGQVQSDRERQLIIKTTAGRVSALEARVRELHEYEVPEFIVVPIIGGSQAYLNWIRESTAG